MNENNYPQPPVTNPQGQPAQQPQYQQPGYPQQPYQQPGYVQVPHGVPVVKPQMGFVEACKTCFIDKYCCFTGRARRSEYWWYMLGVFIIQTILSAVTLPFLLKTIIETNDPMAIYTSPIYWVMCAFSLVFLLPSLGAMVRRLHDTGRSGHWLWLYFICIIPIVGAIVLLVFAVILIVWTTQDSDPRPNKYGPSPKYN